MKLYPLIFLLVFACSTVKKNTLSTVSLNTLRTKVNLNGEGKTRFEFGDRQYVFQFTSVTHLNPHRWILSFRVPFQDEIQWSIHQDQKLSLETRQELKKIFMKEGVSSEFNSELFLTDLKLFYRWYQSTDLEDKKCCVKKDVLWSCQYPQGLLQISFGKDEIKFLTVSQNAQYSQIFLRYLEGNLFNRVTIEGLRKNLEQQVKVDFRQEIFFTR